MVFYQMRKNLSAQGMYSLIRQKSLNIPDVRQPRSTMIPLSDAVMSAVAMFAFKHPSMLQFCSHANEVELKANLKSFFGIDRVPSDTARK